MAEPVARDYGRASCQKLEQAPNAVADRNKLDLFRAPLRIRFYREHEATILNSPWIPYVMDPPPQVNEDPPTDHPRSVTEWLPLIYQELRALAAAKMAREREGDTLQPTALVHEAWMRMKSGHPDGFLNRNHFIGVAAEAMRHILVERARRRLALKRGGGVVPVNLDQVEIASPAANDDELLAMHDALEKFAALEPRKAELVKLRYFVGLSFGDAAAALNIAVPTAKQWWAFARAWLRLEIAGAVRDEPSSKK